MREQDALHARADLGEGFDPVTGALVVEGHEDVVGDEGRRLEPRRVALHIGETQGEIELVARALAQAFDPDVPVLASPPDQNGAVLLVILRAEPDEGASGERGEQRAGAREKRVLRGFPVAFDRRAQEKRPELEDGPIMRGRHQYASRIALHLRRELRAGY